MKEVDIEKLSQLANIDLSQVDREKLQDDLEKIINHIEKIGEINVENIEETTHPYQTELPFRDDIPSESLAREKVLFNTEKKFDGFFMIERLIDEDNY